MIDHRHKLVVFLLRLLLSLRYIIVEFYTRLALFQTHDNLEHSVIVEAVMSKIPGHFARGGTQTNP